MPQNKTKNSKVNMITFHDLPLAGIYLSLEGKIKNLEQALICKNSKLILKRRIELSNFFMRWSVLIERKFSNTSILERRILSNIKITLQSAQFLMEEASLFLASQLSVS